MTDEPTASIQPRPAPWGVFGTIAWSVVGVAAWAVAQLVASVFYAGWARLGFDIERLSSNAAVLAIGAIVACPVWIGIVAIAARWRGWKVRDYLALIPPTGKYLLLGIACGVALEVATDLLWLGLGLDLVPPAMIEAHKSAQASGTLTLLFIAAVIAAPVAEEIAFRGFAFRGLSESWIGVAGTILLTSAVWAAMHVQYDWLIMTQIFVTGLLWGWLRWVSGSTLLVILLHMAGNLAATVEVAVKVAWMS